MDADGSKETQLKRKAIEFKERVSCSVFFDLIISIFNFFLYIHQSAKCKFLIFHVLGSSLFPLRLRSIQFSSHGYDRTQQSQCQIGGSIISFFDFLLFFFSLSIFFDSDDVLALFFSPGSSRGHGCWEIQPRYALCQGSISRISGYFSILLFDFVLLIGKFFEFYWVCCV